MRHTTAVAVAASLLLATGATGCGESPTTTSPASSRPVPGAPATSPRVDGPHEITGVVTDEQGAPVTDAEVAMTHYENNEPGLRGLRRPTTRTDSAGRYAISFSIDPSRVGLFARAEVVAEGFDWHWRNFSDPGRRRVENFRLRRHRRIAAGETMVVSVSRDNGDCIGWLHDPCGRLRVTASSAGDLTIEAVPTLSGAALPTVEAWEQQGNPLTLHVPAGSETSVEIGQGYSSASTPFSAPTVLVKTSFKPD